MKLACSALVVGFALASAARAQVVDSVTLVMDDSGDGAGHVMDGPFAVRTDAEGNLYVGSNSCNVLRATPTGEITELIGFLGDGNNPLITCRALAVDGLGHVFAAGLDSDNAFRIDAGGAIEKIIDATGDGVGHGLNQPWVMAADSEGNAYVPGVGSHNVFKIDLAGAITQIIDASGDGAGHALNRPWGVAVDGAGNVYVTGNFSDNAFRITPSGTITQIIDASGDGAGHALDDPYEIAVDGQGNVFVTGGEGDNVFRITPAGVITQIIDGSGDGLGHTLVDARSIATDTAGNVYVAGILSNNVFQIAPSGVITQIIDETGDGAGQAFAEPRGIAVNPAGDVFVSSRLNSRVFKIDLETAGTWIEKGLGLAGISGVPQLSGIGDPQAGSSITLTLSQTQPLAPSLLILGLTAMHAPFKGGTLVPHVDAWYAMKTDAQGGRSISGTWPAGLPSGTQFYVQWWIADPAGPLGFAATNALKTTEP